VASFLESRTHAARRLWRSLNGRASGPDFRAVPAQLRQWHIQSLRALDARLHDPLYRDLGAWTAIGTRKSTRDKTAGTVFPARPLTPEKRGDC